MGNLNGPYYPHGPYYSTLSYGQGGGGYKTGGGAYEVLSLRGAGGGGGAKSFTLS